MNHSLSTALTALLLTGGITAASAQVLTVTGAVSPTRNAAGRFTYTYTVTPSGISPGGANFDVNLLVFNFSDANVVFTTAVNGNPAGTPQLGLTSSVPNTGVFTFDSGTLLANTTELFSFESSDASTGGGTVGATGVSYNGSGVAAINNVSPAPTPAPEPSQTAALGLGVLGLAGMVFTARRRKMLSN